ncbi:MAG: serine hydrolase [Candidatus Eisenbacteria bacterium]|nr:serine hydrolase [Candidatus Latescibacterota bacterium]MBD3302483.1 serine hydrolase [Candidatus Eisenbacteria bacterium]
MRDGPPPQGDPGGRGMSRLAGGLLVGGCLLAACVPDVRAQREEPGWVDLTRSEFVEPNLGEKLDGILAKYEESGLSGTIVVGWGGLIVLHKGYGLADRETGRANGAATLFPIGPLTRQFTAAAILRLSGEGRLDLDDPIAEHLGPFPAPKDTVTIRHLLAGTSGLVREPAAVLRGEREAFLRAVREAEIAFPPGTETAPSPVEAILLAAIVETASGTTFESYLRDSLFAPAGLHATGFPGDSIAVESPPATAYRAGGSLLPTLARFPPPRHTLSLFRFLYAGNQDDLEPVPSRSYDWSIRGAGGIVSTAGDLFRWQMALRGEKILNGAEKAAFAGSGDQPAYGWTVEETRRGTPRLVAGGRGAGIESAVVVYENYLRYVPKDLVIVFAGNNDLGWGRAVWMTLEDVVYGEDYSVPLAVVSILIMLIVIGGASRQRKGRRVRILGRPRPPRPNPFG